MIKRKRATIRTVLFVQYSKILAKARKGVKGLRLQHLDAIMILGEHSEGLPLIQMACLMLRSKQSVYATNVRCVRAGFIRKENKRYYLTDSGQQVYNTICREFDQSFKMITRTILEDAGI